MSISLNSVRFDPTIMFSKFENFMEKYSIIFIIKYSHISKILKLTAERNNNSEKILYFSWL